MFVSFVGSKSPTGFHLRENIYNKALKENERDQMESIFEVRLFFLIGVSPAQAKRGCWAENILVGIFFELDLFISSIFMVLKQAWSRNSGNRA